MSDLRTARARPDPRERFARQFFRMVNPLARWMMSVGLPTGSRNILLTVRGRRSGTPRTTPLSMLELEGRSFVQASYSEDGWARNLRAAGQAIMTDHGRRIAVQTVELPPEKAAAIIRRALEPYRRSRLIRALLGRACGHPSLSCGGSASASMRSPRSTLPRLGAIRCSSSDRWSTPQVS
jgi:deazaflavin-dependent oxidoreductase (nitroreductase family)